MNNENNISFKELQNFEVAPPAFLLQNIKSEIAIGDITDLRKTFAPLYNHLATPAAISFEQIMQKIKTTEQINVFTKLNNYQQEPTISFAKIMERLRALGYFKNTYSAKVIPFGFIKKIIAAAAVILLLIGGYFLLNNKSNITEGSSMVNTDISSQNTNSTTTNNFGIELPITNDSTSPINNLAQNNSTETNSLKTNKNRFISKNEKIVYASISKKYKKVNKQSNIAPKLETISINGENFTVLENDYLSTFASFTPDKLPTFLQAETPVETQITIDKYSYFNVTDVMGGMMKKMYATKSSGAPTRSARRQKQKLESWKKADSAYFLPSSNVNPLDPRDLGNLILNK